MDIINFCAKRRLREQWNNAGKDVVVLHQYWRGKFCPSLSPLVMNVESFLRLNKIKYVSDYEVPMIQTGSCPWITLNGEDTCDSRKVIAKLVKHFELDVDAHITEMRIFYLENECAMIEHPILWFFYTWRYKHDDSDRFLDTQVFPSSCTKFFFKYLIRFHTAHNVEKRKMDSLSIKTQNGLIVKSIKDLNDVFGEGPYFGGDKPCTADCVIFGYVSQFVWNEPGSKYEKLVKEEYPLLLQYCFSMKELLFPDWGLLLNPPDTSKNTATQTEEETK